MIYLSLFDVIRVCVMKIYELSMKTFTLEVTIASLKFLKNPLGNQCYKQFSIKRFASEVFLKTH